MCLIRIRKGKGQVLLGPGVGVSPWDKPWGLGDDRLLKEENEKFENETGLGSQA